MKDDDTIGNDDDVIESDDDVIFVKERQPKLCKLFCVFLIESVVTKMHSKFEREY